MTTTNFNRTQNIDTWSWKELLADAMVEKLGVDKALEIVYAAQQKGSRGKLVEFVELLRRFDGIAKKST